MLVAETLYNKLFNDISSIYENARKKGVAAVNEIIVAANWEIGKRIVEDEQKGELNRRHMKAIVAAGETPGLLAYVDAQPGGLGGQPAGWCSLAPRSAFATLERSRILKAVDSQPVWSVVCFFIARPYRRQGLTGQLLQAAVEYARAQGAQVIEGYPVEPKQGQAPDVFVFTGLASAFRQAGFVEVARRSETRPIMRRVLA